MVFDAADLDVMAFEATGFVDAGRPAGARPLDRLAAGRSGCLRTGSMRGRGSFLARGALVADADLALVARAAGLALAAVAFGALAARASLAGAALVAGFAAALAMLRGARAVTAGLLARAFAAGLDSVALDLAALAGRLAAGLAIGDLLVAALPFALVPPGALAVPLAGVFDFTALAGAALAIADLAVADLAVADLAVADLAFTALAFTGLACAALAPARDGALVGAGVAAVLRPSVRIAIGCARRLAKSRSR